MNIVVSIFIWLPFLLAVVSRSAAWVYIQRYPCFKLICDFRHSNHTPLFMSSLWKGLFQCTRYNTLRLRPLIGIYATQEKGYSTVNTDFTPDLVYYVLLW